MTPGRHRLGLRMVAVFEGAKGFLVLAAGMGALSLLHRDVEHIAEAIVRHFSLEPAHRFPQIFLDFAGRLNDHNLMLLALGAAAYAFMRFVEAYGLWHGRHWAEWFAVLTGGVYLFIEIYELFERVTPVRLGLFLGNLAVVAYLAVVLRRNLLLRRAARAAMPPVPPG